MQGHGYRAIKIHPYCVLEDDMRLVRTLGEEFTGRDIDWSLNADGMYTRDQALRMGRLLDATGWTFFEAPLPDTDLKGYKALADALDLDVICGGNSLPDVHLIDIALAMGAWDRSRFDVTGIGGFTGAGEAMAVTHSHGKKGEIQSWGYTLTQAANLHLMLAHPNCNHFEQAAPYEKYEFGAQQVIRPDADGLVHPSGLPGLGIELDRERIESFIYARRVFTVGVGRAPEFRRY